MKIYKKLLIGTLFFSLVFCQNVPSHFFLNQYTKLNYDLGLGWDKLSNFSNPRFQNSDSDLYQNEKNIAFSGAAGDNNIAYLAYVKYSYKKKYFFIIHHGKHIIKIQLVQIALITSIIERVLDHQG